MLKIKQAFFICSLALSVSAMAGKPAATKPKTPRKPYPVAACIYSIDERDSATREGLAVSGNFIIPFPKNSESMTQLEFTPNYIMRLTYQRVDGFMVAQLIKRPGNLVEAVAMPAGAPILMNGYFDYTATQSGVSPIGQQLIYDMHCFLEYR